MLSGQDSGAKSAGAVGVGNQGVVDRGRGASDRYLLRAYTDRLGNPALAGLTADALTAPLLGKSPSTWNRHRNTILAILHHAEKIGWMGKPPGIPTRKTPAGRTRWLTHQEWARLEAQLPDHLLAPARFAIATGIRRANVLGLQWCDVDLARKVMWIHPDEAKAGKAIGIPLSAPAIDILRSQIGQHATHVFTYEFRAHGKTERRPMREIGEAYPKAVKRAGLTGVNWHTLRHTWASWHVMNGTPLEVLQKLGGWNSLQMVLRYAHLAPEYLATWVGNSDISSDSATRSDTVTGGFGQKKGRSKAA